MRLPYVAATTGPAAPAPPSEPPVLGTTAIIVIAVVLGGILLAWVAASVIKALGTHALNKASAEDVPAVLKVLGTWIAPFTKFMPHRWGPLPADPAAPTAPSTPAPAPDQGAGSA
ncbi:hypothetical protein [Streptodolium elevatio]|uniref:Uncharacterized protein n=1 Tax=Streptodolium elevatio TaxID=3157996 RepID=A0ABV3DIB3_9ACTN